MPSTSINSERALLEKHFLDGWASTTPVQFENVKFEEPKNRAWVRLTIVNGAGFPLSINVGMSERHNGVVIAQIFTPKDQGTAEAKVLADKVSDIFRTKRISYGDSGILQTFVPSPMNVGTREGWYQINVRTPFHRIQSHTTP